MIRGPRYELRAVETRTFTLDGGAMFGVVPRPLWSRKLAPDAHNGVRMAMRCLLIQGEGRTILVDCGMGDGYDEVWHRRYALDPAQDQLLANLAAWGVSEEDVTDLIVTHLHFDHTGGVVRPDAGGALRPTFPRARHHVQAAHLAHARAPTPKDRASFLSQRFEPVAEAGLFVTHAGTTEIAPGVRLIPVRGHSPGMQIVHVRDGQTDLLHLADLVPTSAHLPLAWVMAYDNEPLATLDEKARWVVPHVERGGVVFFEHDPDMAAACFAWAEGKPALRKEVDLT